MLSFPLSDGPSSTRAAIGSLVLCAAMSENAHTFATPGPNPHKVAGGGAVVKVEPLEDVAEVQRLSAAEQARTILQHDEVATLATLTSDGSPWASMVQYAVTDNGEPVLVVSTLALHGRNLTADPRASIAVAGPVPDGHDPGDSGRVTLAGKVEKPTGSELDAAVEAFTKVVPSAAGYIGWDDFDLYILRVDTVRWVGGFGRMASSTPAEYAVAEPDPTARGANYAVKHMNEDHADSLLEMARAFTGHTDATSATALRADRYGMDLGVETPRGDITARVGFTEPVESGDGLRAAVVALAKAAREKLGLPAPSHNGNASH